MIQLLHKLSNLYHAVCQERRGQRCVQRYTPGFGHSLNEVKPLCIALSTCIIDECKASPTLQAKVAQRLISGFYDSLNGTDPFFFSNPTLATFIDRIRIRHFAMPFVYRCHNPELKEVRPGKIHVSFRKHTVCSVSRSSSSVHVGQVRDVDCSQWGLMAVAFKL